MSVLPGFQNKCSLKVMQCNARSIGYFTNFFQRIIWINASLFKAPIKQTHCEEILSILNLHVLNLSATNFDCVFISTLRNLRTPPLTCHFHKNTVKPVEKWIAEVTMNKPDYVCTSQPSKYYWETYQMLYIIPIAELNRQLDLHNRENVILSVM